jgi:hypothetical protein
MKLTEIRQLVRLTVKRQLAEAAAASSNPPKTWGEFRQQFANVLEMCGAPSEFVDEVGDMSSEGGGIARVLYDAWQNIQSELESGPAGTDLNNWLEVCDFYIHDAVIDMVSEFENAWNYEPGSRKNKRPIVHLHLQMLPVLLGLPKRKLVLLKMSLLTR